MELCVLNPEEANIKRLVDAINNGKSQEWFDKAACWSIIPRKFLCSVARKREREREMCTRSQVR